MVIKSINWTYTDVLDSLTGMDSRDQSQDLEATGATTHECECPEPCNCDHENE
jgi:hypothetical protein